MNGTFPFKSKIYCFLVGVFCLCMCVHAGFPRWISQEKYVNWAEDNGESFGNGTIVYMKKKVTQILWMIRVLQRFSMFSLSAELYSLFIISYDKPCAVSIGYEHKRRPQWWILTMAMRFVVGNEARQHTSWTQFFIYASFTSNSLYLTFLPFRFAMTAGKVDCTALTNGYYWDFFITFFFFLQNKTILSL